MNLEFRISYAVFQCLLNSKFKIQNSVADVALRFAQAGELGERVGGLRHAGLLGLAESLLGRT